MESQVIGAEGVAEHVSRPGSELRESLQLLERPVRQLAPLASAKRRDYRKRKRCVAAVFSLFDPQLR
jgi:uncharacterized protein VirK/YbjX